MTEKTKHERHYSHPNLPYLESVLCHATFIPLILYPFYHTYELTLKYKDQLQLNNTDYFQDGWLSSRKKDIYDVEWSFWWQYTSLILLMCSISSTGGFLCRTFTPKYISLYYSLSSIILLTFALSIQGTLLIVIDIVIVFIVISYFKSLVLFWMFIIGYIYHVITYDALVWHLNLFIVDQKYLDIIQVSLMMSILRMVSFGCEVLQSQTQTISSTDQMFFSVLLSVFSKFHTILGIKNVKLESVTASESQNNEVKKKSNRNTKVQESKSNLSNNEIVLVSNTFTAYIHYVLYIPLFFNGPVLTYDLFDQNNRRAYEASLKEVLKDSFTCLFYGVCLEVLYHFIYIATLSGNIDILTQLSPMESISVAWVQILIFCIKYYVFYRTSGIFAKIDGYNPPGTPKCIVSLYTFVDMWRYFDKGLYRLLQRCIYFPLGGSKYGLTRQIFASMLCFAFVGYWHHFTYDTMFWAFTNWFGIIIEAVLSILSKKLQLHQRIGGVMYRRLCAACGSVSIFALVYSNNIYVTMLENANILLFNTLSSKMATLKLLLVLYTSVHCSIDASQK